MKVMYFIKDISVIGGRETILLKKAMWLVSKGFDVTVLSHCLANKSVTKTYPEIKFLSLDMEDNIPNNTVFKWRYLRELINRIKNTLSNTKIDVFISMTDFGYSSVCKVINSRYKYLEVHGCFDYYNNYKNDNGSIKIISYIRAKYRIKKMRASYCDFDKVIVLSEVDRKKWECDNIQVIHNFLEEKSFLKKRAKLDLSNSIKCFAAGRFDKVKGFDLLVKIWEELIKHNPDINIDVIGDGPELESVRNMITTKKLERNITLLPFTSELEKEILGYDLLILPSRFESFPMIVLEAMSKSIPVVSFNIDCGLKEMLLDNVNGFSVEKYEVKKFANKILEINNDRKLYDRFSTNSYEQSRLFHEDTIMEKWCDLFFRNGRS